MDKDNPYAARKQNSIVFAIPSNWNKLPSENAAIQKKRRSSPGDKIRADFRLSKLSGFFMGIGLRG